MQPRKQKNVNIDAFIELFSTKKREIIVKFIIHETSAQLIWRCGYFIRLAYGQKSLKVGILKKCIRYTLRNMESHDVKCF